MLSGMDKPKRVHGAVIEEGQEVSKRVWEAVERLCAGPESEGKIISVFAPTDALHAAYEAEEDRLDEEEDRRDMRQRRPFIRAASLADDLDG